MFDVSGLHIRITQGDSGLLTLQPRGRCAFTDADRAVFTVRRASGGALMTAALIPDGEGRVQVPFLSRETAKWRPGVYEWDVRYVLDAEEDGDGNVTGGREVITPMRPAALEVLRAVGSI